MRTLNKNSFKIIVLSLVVFLSVDMIIAQNGADLFRNNCSACHKLEGKLVGPGLKGVKAKWTEAGEAANLIKWVMNPAKLYNSGKSTMAKEAWEITPIEMTPQALSEADITAIFTHIDADVIEEKEEEKTEVENFATNPNRQPGDPLTEKVLSKEEAKKRTKETNNTKRALFIFLVLSAFCIVLGIVSISKTIQTFLILKMRKKDDEKKKKNGNGGAIATLVLVLVMLSPFSSYAMSFSFEQDGWLIVSNLDNLLLFAVNIALIFILFEQNKTLKSIIVAYHPSIIKKKKTIEVGDKETSETVINLLTGTVAIEDEASILMDHDYDGIKELDNNLPPWWVWSFAASIVAAFIYLMHFHVLGTGDLQAVEYQKTIDKAQIEVDAYMSEMSMNVDENNVVVLSESSDISAGKGLYKINCVVCHKETGEGLVGPNLTDDHWIYGEGDIKTVFTTIKYGTNNGMSEHESKMNPIELQQVASYVLAMKYVEGKAPEGKKIEQ